jgi:aspartyl-tRNA(Asn)/glutamyl-tRNA(Gln) amidotransferase subunit B
LIEGGGRVVQATRLYDPVKNETREMRSKEEANDYRYFPDPDLLPVVISQAQIDAIAAELPELPEARRARFVSDYSLPEYDARVLTGSRDLADFFEDTVRAAGGVAQAKPSANWVMVELLGALSKAEKEITDSPVSPAQLGGMIARIADNTISGKIAKQVFAEMMSGSGQTADQIIAEKGLKQETDTGAIEAIIRDVLAANPAMVADVKGGKEKAFNGLVGQVMKASKGKANPAQVNELMKKLLAD